jgi:predicted transcriptional regulator
MGTLTVRISDNSRTILQELAAKEKASMQAILDKAIESYRRQHFLTEVNKAYAALRQEPKAWAQVEKERAEWDATLGDGLEPEKQAAENGRMIRRERRKRRG